ncbi:MAG: fructosamine kinase family protein [Gammaproteobacteria bacterium]|nr:fructosamine kinase family protein [Gammaproteobacteria bacterium]
MKPSDWLVVQQLLVDKTGQAIGRLEATSVSGGDINRAYRLSDGQQQFFVKINNRTSLPMFEAEMHGLNEIRASDSIRCPQPIGCGKSGQFAFIVMEYLDLSGSVDATRFAQQLASMHLSRQQQFGYPIENTIGSSPQPNTYQQDWVSFWQIERLGFQLSLARNNGLGSKLFDSGMRLNQQVGSFFSGYSPIASLLHGDLWSGNQGADSAGNPVIYDPACYYGDHEADLAMMELFGRPQQRFFEVYNDVYPIDPGYPQRRELYNLYHILNHANLFGGAYVNQARQMIESLLAQIK